MNSKVKKQLLIGTIVILIIINISALVTILLQNRMDKNEFTGQVIPENDPRQKGMNYYLKNELNLNNNQFELFQDINTTYFKESREIAIKLNNKRILMLNEIANKNPNRENLDQIAREIGELHYELKNNTIEHFLELKSICNKEQQIQLQQFFLKLIDDQEQRPHRRRKGQGSYGNGHGRKRNTTQN